jgi:hypothetical protein
MQRRWLEGGQERERTDGQLRMQRNKERHLGVNTSVLVGQRLEVALRNGCDLRRRR